MGKRQKDTSWELPAGIRNTGLNNLTQTLGSRSREIVERLNNDPTFTNAAGKALTALYDDKAPVVVRSTMEKIKQIMGGRCFLPDEAEALLGLQNRETTSFPKLTGRQIEQLEAFLKSGCPIVGKVPAAETHILFPQPSTIAGATFGVKWLLENALRQWGMKVEACGGGPILDRFYNQVRNPQWFLMFWDDLGRAEIPYGPRVEDLFEMGYDKPDLATYTLALAYLKARGTDIRVPRLFHGSVRLLDDLSASRTVLGGLNVFPKNWSTSPPREALIRRVPLL